MLLLRILSPLFSPQTKEALKREWIEQNKSDLEASFKAAREHLQTSYSLELDKINQSTRSLIEESNRSLDQKRKQLLEFEQEIEQKKSDLFSSFNNLSEEFQSKKMELISSFEQERTSLREVHTSTLDSIHKDFQKVFDDVKSSLDKKLKKADLDQQEVDDLLIRIRDKKEELAKSSNELQTQIRLIEAKASPSSVWVEAFTSGFNKAWDMMIPVMTGGIENLKRIIHDRAVDETLDGLDKHIQERARKLNGNSIH